MIRYLLSFLFIAAFYLEGICIAPTTCNYSGAVSVSGMTIDNDNIWIASWGGLKKFNISNQSMTHYDCSNSGLLSNVIECIYEDSLRNIYLGLKSDGLAIFDGTNWKYIDTLVTGEKITGISYMAPDRNGGLYLLAGYSLGSGSIGYPLTHYQNGQISKVTSVTQFGSYRLTSTPDGDLWSGSTMGLYRFDGQTVTVYDTSNSDFPLNAMSVLGSDDSGRVWLHINSVLGRICTFDGVNVVFYPDNITRDAANSQRMYENPNNHHLYFYSANCNGLTEFDGVNWNYTPNVSGTNDLVAVCFDQSNKFYSCINYGHKSTLKIDDGGSISGFSLNRFDIPSNYTLSVKVANGNKKYFSMYNEIIECDGLTTRILNTPGDLGATVDADLYTDHLNRLWVIDDDIDPGQNFNVAYYDGSNWVTVPVFADFCAEDNSGRMWFTGGSVYVYEGGSIQNIGATFPGFPPSHGPITIDHSMNIWFSDYNRLYRYDGTNMQAFTFTNSPVAQSVGSLGTDVYGNVWTNSANGFCKWDGSSWTVYDSTYFGNKQNVFYRMTCDRSGEIWFGSYLGLTHFDGSLFTIYDKYTGKFGDNFIRDLDFDEFNNVWVATGDNSFSVFNRTGLSAITLLEKKPTAIQGTAFYDLNENGERDSLEYPFLYQPISIYPDSIIHFTNAMGQYRFDVDTGSYEVLAEPLHNYTLTTDSSLYHLAVDTTDLCCYDFGLYSLIVNEAIDVDLSSSSNRCFFPNTYLIHLENTGTVAFNTTIVFKPDSGCNLNSFIPTPYYQSNDSIVWKVNNLLPFMSLTFSAIGTNTTLLGDTLFSTVDVYNTANNVLLSGDTLIQIITCSFDPNDKACQPIGIDTAHFTLMDEWLEYTIRFENSGTDTAFNIVVRDTLSSHLDPSTFRIISSDKQVEASVNPGGALQFVFPDVNLPYLSIDTLGSQGYVKYKVKAFATTPDPTRVTNEAHIFFDFNPAIITNTTWNTLTRTLPTIGINEVQASQSMRVYPNPFSGHTSISVSDKLVGPFDMSLLDITGNVLEKWTSITNQFNIDLGYKYHGIFILELRNKSGIVLGHTRLIII